MKIYLLREIYHFMQSCCVFIPIECYIMYTVFRRHRHHQCMVGCNFICIFFFFITSRLLRVKVQRPSITRYNIEENNKNQINAPHIFSVWSSISLMYCIFPTMCSWYDLITMNMKRVVIDVYTF